MYARRAFRHLGVCVLSVFLLVFSVSAYSDVPPGNAYYTGSLYIVADTNELGPVTIFLPVTYQTGYLSFTGNNLRNVSSSTISGILEDASGNEYTFRLSSWSTPQYRDLDGNSYTYYDLTITSIQYSNIEIADAYPPLVSAADVTQWIPVVLLGVIVLCLFMKRF